MSSSHLDPHRTEASSEVPSTEGVITSAPLPDEPGQLPGRFPSEGSDAVEPTTSPPDGGDFPDLILPDEISGSDEKLASAEEGADISRPASNNPFLSGPGADIPLTSGPILVPPGVATPFSHDTQAPALPPKHPPAGPEGDHPVGETDTLPLPQSPPRDQAAVSPTPSDRLAESYAIKKVSWLDASAGKPELRTSPILIQTINGPCPLLALVNTLVLATPIGVSTPLTEALSPREQISLRLLLDSVFDELTSGRPSDDADELPDMSSLYTFLVTLHTGMIVNPVFVPPSPAELFQTTDQLELYSVFRVALVHGWLPHPDSPYSAAFQKLASTYEDAQNVLALEDSLLEKFCNESGPELTMAERECLEHGMLIKDFLLQNPTQLTDHGLSYLIDAIPPGQFRILFRNDHFSTLYKHPNSNLLMTLVTDAGFATHDEIVWETLVDVSGQASRLLSGDFREVGNHQPPSSSRGRGRARPGDDAAAAAVSPSPTKDEQESRDLALAMQLQEEEEARARGGGRQAGPGSRGWTAGGNGGVPPVIPPRRSGPSGSWRASGDSGESPPPTYDQVAHADRIRGRVPGQVGGLPPVRPPDPIIGRVSSPVSMSSRRRDKEKCVVM